MRSREDIMKKLHEDIHSRGDDPMIVNHVIVELLLDIRDLVSRK